VVPGYGPLAKTLQIFPGSLRLPTCYGKNLAEQRVVVTLTHRRVQTKVREHYRSVKFRVFFDVAPCSRVEVDRLFKGPYCLHHQDDDDHHNHHPV
jgi:hypothetical protein